MARDDWDAQISEADDDSDDNIDNVYLTFAVGGDEFALPVTHVTEIVRLQKIFAVPDVPSHIRGVINLRGKVIPLLDVRTRFGIELVPYTDRTVVVVIEVGDSPTGLVVDRVFDITEILPQDVEAGTASNPTARSSLVISMCKRAERVIFIIDAATLVDGVPVASLQAATSAPKL